MIYIAQGRTHPKLVLDSVDFLLHENVANCTVWRCCFYRKSKCKCRLKTTGNSVLIYNDHNHEKANIIVDHLVPKQVHIIKIAENKSFWNWAISKSAIFSSVCEISCVLLNKIYFFMISIFEPNSSISFNIQQSTRDIFIMFTRLWYLLKNNGTSLKLILRAFIHSSRLFGVDWSDNSCGILDEFYEKLENLTSVFMDIYGWTIWFC